MWTADMNRCPTCPAKADCKDRKKILQTLSTITHEMNTDPEHVDGPGDGVIIVACSQGV